MKKHEEKPKREEKSEIPETKTAEPISEKDEVKKAEDELRIRMDKKYKPSDQ